MRGRRGQLPVFGRGRLAGALAALAVAAMVGRAAPAQESSGGDLAAAPPGAQQRGDKPVREFTDAAGRLCRVYARDVVIEGQSRPAVAVVCREPNGRWVLSR